MVALQVMWRLAACAAARKVPERPVAHDRFHLFLVQTRGPKLGVQSGAVDFAQAIAPGAYKHTLTILVIIECHGDGIMSQLAVDKLAGGRTPRGGQGGT